MSQIVRGVRMRWSSPVAANRDTTGLSRSRGRFRQRLLSRCSRATWTRDGSLRWRSGEDRPVARQGARRLRRPGLEPPLEVGQHAGELLLYESDKEARYGVGNSGLVAANVLAWQHEWSQERQGVASR